MKKRLLKKRISAMTDRELNEHVAYCEGKRMRTLLEKEFDKRFDMKACINCGYPSRTLNAFCSVSCNIDYVY